LEGELCQQISDLSGHNDHLQGQLGEHEQRQQQWQQERGDLEQRLEAQVRDLQGAMAQLQQNVCEREHVEDDLRGQISELTAHNEQLQKQVEEKEKSRGFFG